MNDPLRYGIVGCGGIAPWHARGVELHERAEIVGLCDLNFDCAKKMAEKFGGTPYTDCMEMFDKENLDAISICTPGGTHRPIIEAAAKKGINIIAEKPTEVSREALDAIEKACEDNNVVLAGIFQLRTSPLWKTVHSIITEGLLGKIVLADAYLKYFRTPEYYSSASWRGKYAIDGGGALMNQGIHCVDLLLWSMGPVKKVCAFADHLLMDIESEDTAVCILNYENGAFGVLEGATTVKPGLKHRLEFHGSKGSLRVDGHRIVQLESSELNDQERNRIIEQAVAVDDNSARDPLALGIENHIAQLHDFIDALLEGRSPMVTGKEARKAVDLILAIYESASKGKPVDLK